MDMEVNTNRILVIDDEPEICNFIKDVAEVNGFDAAVTENYDQFRDVYQSMDPTLQWPRRAGRRR